MMDNIPLKSIDEIQTAAGIIGRYQIFVFFATQLPYLVVTGSMLCGAFDGIIPPGINCTNPLYENDLADKIEAMDFRSLMVDMGLVCANNYIPTLLKTAVMVGGVFGATLSGYLADRLGRKPVLLVSITGLAIFNGAIAAFAHYHLALTIILLLLLGFSGGGFMVVNLITLTESTPSQFWRLGLTSFNGWPMGLMFMALVGYFTAHWRWFHLTLAVFAAVCIVPCFFVHESARWLAQIGKIDQARSIIDKTAKFNGKIMPKYNLEKNLAGQETSHEKYSYLTFLKYPKILVLLVALFYSWLASSIISFATYFILDKLIGNRFLNFFLTGLFKGTTGCIPFFVSKWVGRKPVLVAAVATTCAVCWACVIVYFTAGGTTMALTVLTVVGASCIDPIWKINHFYSSELFPTVVRNMARAVCNIGSRVGSVIGPQVAHLREVHVGIPYIIFSVVSSIHLIICITLLPETKGRPLMDRLPDDKSDVTDNNIKNEEQIVDKITKV